MAWWQRVNKQNVPNQELIQQSLERVALLDRDKVESVMRFSWVVGWNFVEYITAANDRSFFISTDFPEKIERYNGIPRGSPLQKDIVASLFIKEGAVRDYSAAEGFQGCGARSYTEAELARMAEIDKITYEPAAQALEQLATIREQEGDAAGAAKLREVAVILRSMPGKACAY